MDEKDRSILKIVQKAGRTPNAEIARRMGLAPSAVFERLRRLEKNGVVRGFFARLDPRAVGRDVLAFVFVYCAPGGGRERTAEALAAIEEVQELHYLAGDDALLLKLRVANLEALERLTRERIGAAPSVERIRTAVALKTWKESTALNLENAETQKQSTKQRTSKHRGRRR